MPSFLLPNSPLVFCSSLSEGGSHIHKARELCSSMASEVICQALFMCFTFYFGVVGTMMGAMAGGVLGVKSGMNFLHGVVGGAVTGACLSYKLVNATVDVISHPEDPAHGLDCFLHLITDFARHPEGRLHQDPDSALVFDQDEAATFEAITNVSKIEITNNNILDTSGNTSTCSICLMDFEIGNVVGSLPSCSHMFHPPCISRWLNRHSSCPLCRRNI